MTPLTVVCWRWHPPRGSEIPRFSFPPNVVTVLRNMVRRHYAKPHRFVCITDRPEEIDSDIETIRDFGDFTNVPSPHPGKKNPSCYRRLRMFSPDIEQHLGKRFVSVDLDCVMTGDVTPLWDRQEDFIAWGDTNPQPGSHYNGSMMMLTAGARPQVWTQFDPRTSPDRSRNAGCWGSDQGWISYCLGGVEAKWSTKDGVYSYRNHISKNGGRLPENARVIFFHGETKPWDQRLSNVSWIREHYGARQEAVA